MSWPLVWLRRSNRRRWAAPFDRPSFPLPFNTELWLQTLREVNRRWGAMPVGRRLRYPYATD